MLLWARTWESRSVGCTGNIRPKRVRLNNVFRGGLVTEAWQPSAGLSTMNCRLPSLAPAGEVGSRELPMLGHSCTCKLRGSSDTFFAAVVRCDDENNVIKMARQLWIHSNS
jgi:hypothetical protein